MEHRRNWRNAVTVLLAGLCATSLWGQHTAVGPVRVTLSPSTSSSQIAKGTSLKLNLLKSFFSNTPPPTSATRNISANAVWTSSDPTVFTVSSHGLATAVAATGSATITASVKSPGLGMQFTIALAAGPAVLQSIALNRFNSSVALATPLSYTATGHYSDGTTTDLTATATWAVVGNIAGTGGAATNTGATITGTAAGIVEVTATSGSVVGASFLNIGLTNLSITPLSPAILPQGATQSFVATADFTGGPAGFDVTNYVRWTSSDGTTAKMSNGVAGCLSCVGGVATGVRQGGPVNINAVSGSATSNTVALTVGPVAVLSVAISTFGCNPASVPLGNSCQFTAIATNSDKSLTNVTSSGSTNWTSTDPMCVVVGSSGLATTLNPPANPNNPCSVNVTDIVSRPSPYGDTVTSNTIGMTVAVHALKSITISPVNPSKPFGTATVPFTVKGHYTDGTTSTINNGTSGLSWASSNTAVATIGSTSGLATIVAQGASTITATYVATGTFNASTKLTITAPTLSSIAVTAVNPVPTTPTTPNATTIPVGGTQQFQAIGTYTDNSQADITTSATWNSSSGAATMSNAEPTQGVATGVSAGVSINITATLGSVTSPGVPLTVQTINSITVNPPAPVINIGQTQAFTATANYAGGITQPLDAFSPTWSSTATNVATVDQSGVATAIAGGSATIKATLGSGTCTGPGCGNLTVSQPTLVSITVECDPDDPCAGSGEAVLSLSQTEQMIAIGNYSDGSTQNLTQVATWNSSAATVATINSTGFVTTVNFGSTNITATCPQGGACPGATSTVTGTLPLTVSF
jgi:hypothetical protein